MFNGHAYGCDDHQGRCMVGAKCQAQYRFSTFRWIIIFFISHHGHARHRLVYMETSRMNFYHFHVSIQTIYWLRCEHCEKLSFINPHWAFGEFFYVVWRNVPVMKFLFLRILLSYRLSLEPNWKTLNHDCLPFAWINRMFGKHISTINTSVTVFNWCWIEFFFGIWNDVEIKLWNIISLHKLFCCRSWFHFIELWLSVDMWFNPRVLCGWRRMYDVFWRICCSSVQMFIQTKWYTQINASDSRQRENQRIWKCFGKGMPRTTHFTMHI